MENSIGKKVFRGTVVIVLVGILAKFTSFIAEAVLAAYLGTTSKSDAYYMVSGVQNVIYPMMSIGIWKVFLPLYKSHIAKNENETACALTNKSLTFFSLISLGVVSLLFLFAPAVVFAVAPGFHEETRTLCIKLVRISAPMYVFIIASSVYASMLQCREKFLGSQIREVGSHIPTILAAIFLYKRFGIEAMAAALVVGGAVRLLIELPFVDWGYRYKPDLKFNTPEFSLMLKRLPSALLTAGVAQLNTLIDKAMASTLPEGTISGLNYGHKLITVFSGLLSTPISTALYPQMVELITLDKRDELGKLSSKIVNLFCTLMVPITLACVLFRTELVTAAFQRGSFDKASTGMTASVFALYSLGLFFLASSAVINNIFYGYGDTKTPMRISLINLLLNVGLNLILIRIWGINGLAFSTSVSAIISFALRVAAARRFIHWDRNGMLTTAAKVIFASTVACLIPRAIFWFFQVNPFLVLLLSAMLGLALYLLLGKLIKLTELSDLFRLIMRKGKRT